MKIRSLVALGSMVVAGLAVGAPIAHADEVGGGVALTGTYKLSSTSVYLAPNAAGTAREARVQLTQVSVSDPAATRMVALTAGAAPVAWASGTTFPLVFTKPGTYSPVVTLTTPNGSTPITVVPAVKVLLDNVAPKIKITAPKKATKVASWKVVRGTASDVGTGLSLGGVFVMQKRGKLWYAYDFDKKKWVKGYSSAKKTSSKAKANPAIFPIKANGTWVAPKIKGLKKGSTVIEALAMDREYNIGTAKVGPRKLR